MNKNLSSSIVLFLISCAACADKPVDPRELFIDIPAASKIELINLDEQYSAWTDEGLPEIESSKRIWRVTVDHAYFAKVSGQKSCFDPERVANNETSCLYAFTSVGSSVPVMFYVPRPANVTWGHSEEETLAHEAMHSFSFLAFGDADESHTNARVWNGVMSKMFPDGE